jgi:DNA gyrase subunit B
VKSARDSTFQAAFPLKGKPMNVYNMTLAKARANAEFDAIERIIGCGTKDRCDPEQCRYDRIMICADADADGGNISALLIVMFLEFFRPLVDAGMVFVTMPPLFVVSQGGTKVYCQNEDDRDVAVAEFRKKNSSKKVEVQRYKGLGEMDAEDFWNTVLDPKQRTLMQLNIADNESADKLNYTLFGGPAVGRRDWIADMSARIDLSELDLGD